MKGKVKGYFKGYFIVYGVTALAFFTSENLKNYTDKLVEPLDADGNEKTLTFSFIPAETIRNVKKIIENVKKLKGGRKDHENET